MKEYSFDDPENPHIFLAYNPFYNFNADKIIQMYLEN